MDNNDILRRLRYTFNLHDNQMIETFAAGEFITDRPLVSNWLKKEDDESFIELTDYQMAAFLNGFIALRRGKLENKNIEPERRLNNNQILRKLKIALELRDEDIQRIFNLAEVEISKNEINAFFRNRNHEQYRECKDQFMRSFLKGLQKKYHPQQ
jgi:uncharacterized protein YehS (DUF1456 family)